MAVWSSSTSPSFQGSQKGIGKAAKGEAPRPAVRAGAPPPPPLPPEGSPRLPRGDCGRVYSLAKHAPPNGAWFRPITLTNLCHSVLGLKDPSPARGLDPEEPSPQRGISGAWGLADVQVNLS